MLTFIDERSAFIKDATIVEQASFPRDQAFCNITIEKPNELLIVPDARVDQRFLDHQKVKSGSIVFYAGAPIVTGDGYAVGALCVTDKRQRSLSERQQEALKRMARITAALVQTRLKN